MGKWVNLGSECSVDVAEVVAIHNGFNPQDESCWIGAPLMLIGNDPDAGDTTRAPRGALLLRSGEYVPFYVTKETVETRLAAARDPEAAAEPQERLTVDELDMIDSMLERWVRSGIYPNGQPLDEQGAMRIVNLGMKLSRIREAGFSADAERLAKEGR